MLKQSLRFVTDTLLTGELSPDAMYEPYDALKTVQNALAHEFIRDETLFRFMNAAQFSNRSCCSGIRLFKD